MPPVFYDPNQAVRSLFMPQAPVAPQPVPPPAAPPPQTWWQQPRTEQEIHRQDLMEHGNQALGVGRLDRSDPNTDPAMNRLRPSTEQRTGDTFMGVDPEAGEMQGDPSLRENIGFQTDLLSRLWQGLSQGLSQSDRQTAPDPGTRTLRGDLAQGSLWDQPVYAEGQGWETGGDFARAYPGRGSDTAVGDWGIAGRTPPSADLDPGMDALNPQLKGSPAWLQDRDSGPFLPAMEDPRAVKLISSPARSPQPAQQDQPSGFLSRLWQNLTSTGDPEADFAPLSRRDHPQSATLLRLIPT